jgi:hypothetical protein
VFRKPFDLPCALSGLAGDFQADFAEFTAVLSPCSREARSTFCRSSLANATIFSLSAWVGVISFKTSWLMAFSFCMGETIVMIVGRVL